MVGRFLSKSAGSSVHFCIIKNKINLPISELSLLLGTYVSDAQFDFQLLFVARVIFVFFVQEFSEVEQTSSRD